MIKVDLLLANKDLSIQFRNLSMKVQNFEVNRLYDNNTEGVLEAICSLSKEKEKIMKIPKITRVYVCSMKQELSRRMLCHFCLFL
jgi:Cu2+-containing amine oxidase